MGTKIKPGQFDCYGAALPDEPMFILLARDPDAAEAVRWWVTLRQARIGRGEKPLEDHALLAEALSCAAAMVSWRDEASDPHTYGTTPRWKLPQAGTPMGGAEVDWPTLQSQTYVWEFGNRFRMWEALGDYWFAEWTEDEDSGHWSGAYPLQRNLQKEMLIAAYNDHRAAVQHKVEAVKSLLPLPHYSDIVRLVRDVARIKLDLDDFDGDRRGIAHALGEAGEALVEFVEAHAKDFDADDPAPSVATSALKDAEDLYASLTAKERLMSPGAQKRNSREVALAAKLVRALGGNPEKPDIYAEFAERLGTDRPTAKARALGAGYGGDKAESDLIDVTDTPELPPHRFTIFTKSKHWGYGRGLEINPSHIPDMLDRMMDDGYVLQAVFGGVEPTKVGMLFRRYAVGGKVDFTAPRIFGGGLPEMMIQSRGGDEDAS